MATMLQNLPLRKPNLLCIVPPYPITVPPAGAAALMGYLKVMGCEDFEFLDLRLYSPQAYAPTFAPVGVFGESFVLEVPDLPIVLRLCAAARRGEEFLSDGYDRDPVLAQYCLERGISPGYLVSYLRGLDGLLHATLDQLVELEFVGFTTWTSNYLSTLMAASVLKRRGRKAPFIVLGGPQVTESLSAAKIALRSGLVDAIIPGEGEEALLGLYSAFRAGSRTAGEVAGVMTFQSSTGEFRKPARQLMNISQLPLPSFEKMDLASYQSRGSGKMVLPMQMSRGCTDKCSFCSEWALWERFRSDNVDHVIAQIEQLRRIYDIDGIAFTDSLLNGVMGRLQGFAEQLLAKGVSLQWGGFMRANMDLPTAQLLKRAGCVLAFIGVESFSDETLAIMNKRRRESDNLSALTSFLNAGIAVRAGFIPGFPGDTRERFVKTAATFVALQTKYPKLLALGIEPFVVTPGQPIFKNLAQYGLSPHVWEDAYLDIEPGLRDVSEAIVCSVTGPNQGSERMGQYNIAIALSQSGRSRSDVKRRASRIEEADFMYYSYDPEEVESRYEMQFVPVEPRWCFGTLKTDSGLIYGCLLSFEEWKTLESERRSKQLMAPWTSTFGVLNEQWFLQYMERVEAEHLVPPRRDMPQVLPSVYQGELEEGARVCLSPFVIARSWRAGEAGGVTAVHLVSRVVMQLPLSFESFLRSASNPFWMGEVESALEQGESGIRLQQLVQSGWIRSFDTAVNESRSVLGELRQTGQNLVSLRIENQKR